MLPDNLWRSLSWTWSGVDLFFILSGFLIGRILMLNKESPNYFKTFYVRRVFRIFPLYYLVFIAYVLMVEFGLTPKFQLLLTSSIPQFSYIFYLQNFFVHTNGFGSAMLSPTWSLAIEEQFYLLFPLLIYYLPNKQLPKWFIMGIFIAPVFRGLLGGMGAYVLLPARMDSLLFGALIAYFYKSGQLQKALTRYRNYLGWLLLLMFVLLVISLYKETTSYIGGVFSHSFFMLFYGLILVIVLLKSDAKDKSFLNNSILAYLGKISYGIYLFHQVVLYLFVPLIQDGKYQPMLDDAQSVYVTLLSLGVTIALASVAYFVIERPLIKIGKKYSY